MSLSHIFNLITILLFVAILIVSVESKDRYIVVLNSDPDFVIASTSHYAWVKSTLKDRNLSFIKSFLPVKDKDAIQIFSNDDGLKGYSGWFDASFVTKLEARSEVKYVEKDAKVKINYAIPLRRAVQNNPNPNLDRIDQASFPLNGKFNFPDTAGEGVDVYVVDTGIRTTHEEFENRASSGGVFCDGCPDTDDNGHGSHVAGIIAGKTFGVAKKANVIGVKVLAADGSGSNIDVVNGLQSILEDRKARKNTKTVVNMSLGGGLSAAVNDAVKTLTDAGCHVVVAAGNEAEDACGSSPASEPSAITVGATEETDDNIAFFSNFGRCLDIFAPGSNILSVGIESDTSTQVFSGTSQASPHVAGAVALIISENGNKSPADMANDLLDLSTKGEVQGLDNDTDNNFLRVPAP